MNKSLWLVGALISISGCIGASKRDAASSPGNAAGSGSEQPPATGGDDSDVEAEVASESLILHLKASNLTAGALGTWTDSSGKGHNAVQTSGAAKPEVVSSGGYEAVRFSGSQYMDIAGHADFDDQTISAVIAFKSNATPSAKNNIIRSRFDGQSGWAAYIQTDYQFAWQMMDDASVASSAFATPVQTNQKYVSSMVWGSDIEATMVGWLNGAYTYFARCGGGCLEYPLNTNFSGNQLIRIGSDVNSVADTLNGDIYEIRLYNRGLTDEEREEIECKVASDNGINIGC